MNYRADDEFRRDGLWQEHAPGCRACSECPGGRALPCIYGGLVHTRLVEVATMPDGTERRRFAARCDCCGPRLLGGGEDAADASDRRNPANIV